MPSRNEDLKGIDELYTKKVIPIKNNVRVNAYLYVLGIKLVILIGIRL